MPKGMMISYTNETPWWLIYRCKIYNYMS